MMYNPPHPGEIINELCLKPLNLGITETAKGLGVTRKTLSGLVNGHTGISPLMAFRLSIAFGGTPESWLAQQMQYELWHVQKDTKNLQVKSFL